MAGTPSEKSTTVGPKGVHDDQRVDEAAKESFPASDPPSHTGITGPGGDSKPSGKAD